MMQAAKLLQFLSLPLRTSDVFLHTRRVRVRVRVRVRRGPTTGPKDSSCMTRMEWSTSVSTVGGKNHPLAH